MEMETLILTLYYLDDSTLLSACKSNKKIYQNICKYIWIKRIIDNFGLNIEDINKYKGPRTYQQYYFYIKNSLNKKDYGYYINYIINERIKGGEWNHLTGVLVKAVKDENNYDIAKAAIHAGADVNAPEMVDSYFPNEVDFEIIKLLVEAGSDPSDLLLVGNYDKDIIKYLLDHGAKMDTMEIIYLIDTEQYNNIKNLIEMGYQVQESDIDLARQWEDAELLGILLGHS